MSLLPAGWIIANANDHSEAVVYVNMSNVFYVRQNDDGTSAIFTTHDKVVSVRQSAGELLKQLEIGAKA